MGVSAAVASQGAYLARPVAMGDDGAEPIPGRREGVLARTKGSPIKGAPGAGLGPSASRGRATPVANAPAAELAPAKKDIEAPTTPARGVAAPSPARPAPMGPMAALVAVAVASVKGAVL